MPTDHDITSAARALGRRGGLASAKKGTTEAQRKAREANVAKARKKRLDDLANRKTAQ